MVALAFVAAAWVISSELKRKEKQGLLLPREEMIIVGQPASFIEILVNFAVGFLFGFKVIGLIMDKAPEANAQDYIFSGQGNFVGGLIIGLIMAGLKWWDKNKEKLKVPEKRTIRIWPHDRVGDIVILALVFGILGSKLFDAVEHWDKFIDDPIGTLISPSGLTFYGGLIMAAIAICWFAYRKGIKIRHLVDSAAPAVMIAYAIGRIGCQVAGDGDWGVFNSAYVSDAYGKVRVASPGEYQATLQKNATYFIDGRAANAAGQMEFVTDRTYGSLDKVPARNIKGASFLPTWFFAYSFPQNVNNDGILIPGVTEDHNRVLPQPVLPTSLYETLICALFFAFLWAIRRRIKIPYVMFGIYLILNGAERFFIETVRVNKTYDAAGYTLSQAEIIALTLVIAGVLLVAFANWKKKLLTTP